MHNTDWSYIAQAAPLTFLSRLDNSPQPYALAIPSDADGSPIDNVEGLAIYLHGHSSNWRQGFLTDTFGGCFARLHTELQTRRLAYATLDYRGTTSWMSPAAEADLTQLIELLTTQLKTSKVYLLGGSMGGSSTVAYAALHPELLSGAIALCPATDIGDFHRWCRTRSATTPGQLADAIEASHNDTPASDPALFTSRSALHNHANLTMPLVLVHGDSDDLIPVSYSRDLTTKLQAIDAPVFYDEIKGGDHDAPVIEANWPRYFDFLESNQGTVAHL